MMDQSVTFNFLSRSDGSALYTLDKTVVLASITGPASVKIANRIHNKCFLDVCFLPSTGQPMIKERAIEGVINECIEAVIISNLHPKTGISLNIQEMQSEHEYQLLSASLNASCLALLDACIQMNGLYAAVCIILNKQGVILVEPSNIDLEESQCVFVFVFSNDYDLISQQQKGKVNIKDYDTCLNRAKEAVEVIFRFYRSEIEKKYTPGGSSCIQDIQRDTIVT